MSPRAATRAPPSPTRWAARRRGADRHPHEPVRAGASAGSGRIPAAHRARNGRRLDAARRASSASGFGYFLEQATRPQTIGYALLDSPVALAAWMLDHDTDSYYKISSAFVEGKPSGNLTRDHILDNITLYWLTGTGASAARSYWEGGQATARRGRQGSATGLAPSRVHHVPRRDLPRPRAAGSSRPTPTSSTTTRSTRAATSPPGKSPSCSPRRSEPPSEGSVSREPRTDERRPQLSPAATGAG